MRFDRPGMKRPSKFRPADECRAVGCRQRQSAGLIMCGPHWRSLPSHLHDALLRAANHDEELAAISNCVRYVAEIEGPIA